MVRREPVRSLAGRPAPRREHDVVRFLSPELPPLTEVASYYEASEREAWFSNGGPCFDLLSRRIEAYLGEAAHALPVANCTTGLMVALRAAFGEPGAGRSLVALPSFTFTASACAVVWAGFEPLFVDVLPDSWQLDPAALDRAIDGAHGAVAGVLACSTFGSAPPADVRGRWREACEVHDVPLVLDSAAGFGSTDERGRRIGGLGETEVFSFHATKPFAVGEGGAIATSDPELLARAAKLVNFGMEPGAVASQTPGLNGKCSELQAAAALAMLDRYDDVLRRRRATAARVGAAVGDRVARQRGSEGSTFQCFQALLPSADERDRALSAAASLVVQARSYFDPPLHRQEAFARWAPPAELAVSDDLASRSLSLPMANDLPDEHVERIGRVVAGSRALAA
jgi:dTDP-4-amino-4,6-dideoxygalactose transaminase